MSIKKLVSIKIPVYEAMEDMGTGESRNLPLFKRWAVSADERIGSYYSYKRNICNVVVDECHAELPCDVVAVLAIAIGDHGCDCGTMFQNIYSQFGHSNGTLITSLNGYVVSDGVISCQPLSWEIQNNHIVFAQNLHGQTLTIQYLGYENDAEGWPLVSETHIDAIAAYIQLKEAERSMWKVSVKTQSEQALKRLDREWHRLCRNARGQDSVLSESDRQEIVAMINDPLSGIAMAQWALKNNYYYSYYYGI